MIDLEQQFSSLCYHYVRTKDNEFPKILGNDIDEFQKHVDMIQKKFSIISPNDVFNFYYNKEKFQNKNNVLFTFDDGLSDHFEAAKILHEKNINAMFFIPTCFLDEKLPANPMIIHYCIAEFGIKMFLESYNKMLDECKISEKEYFIQYNERIDNVWDKINQIKSMFKYSLEHNLSRKILIKIYQKLFLKKYPEGLQIIHLDENKIRKMIEMGHTIGAHSHSHLSIGATKLNTKEFDKEVNYPKKILEKKFGIDVLSFSYPFGEKQDCLSSSELFRNTNKYKIGFTVEEKINTKDTSPLLLGRHMPTSTENSEKLSLFLNKMFNA